MAMCGQGWVQRPLTNTHPDVRQSGAIFHSMEGPHPRMQQPIRLVPFGRGGLQQFWKKGIPKGFPHTLHHMRGGVEGIHLIYSYCLVRDVYAVATETGF